MTRTHTSFLSSRYPHILDTVLQSYIKVKGDKKVLKALQKFVTLALPGSRHEVIYHCPLYQIMYPFIKCDESIFILYILKTFINPFIKLSVYSLYLVLEKP